MAQREVWQKPVTDPEGNVIEGASVAVFEEDGQTVATIYQSLTGAVKDNPFLTGSDGLARFYADPGRYLVRAQKGSLLTENIDVDLSMKALRADLSAEGGASLVRGSTFTVNSIKDLADAPKNNGRQVSVSSFWPNLNLGGGLFVWNPTRPKADHNGGTVIDPDKLSELGLITDADPFIGYFEFSESGDGCFERTGKESSAVNPYEFGYCKTYQSGMLVVTKIIEAFNREGGGHLRMPENEAFLLGGHNKTEWAYLTPYVEAGDKFTWEVPESCTVIVDSTFAIVWRPTGLGYDGGKKNFKLIGGGKFQGLSRVPSDQCFLSLNPIHLDGLLVHDIIFDEVANGHIFDLMGCDGIDMRRLKFVGSTLDFSSNRAGVEYIQFDYASSGSRRYVITEDNQYMDFLPCGSLHLEDITFEAKRDAEGVILSYPQISIGNHNFAAANIRKLTLKNIQIEQTDPNALSDRLNATAIKIPPCDELDIDNMKYTTISEGRTDYVGFVAYYDSTYTQVLEPSIDPETLPTYETVARPLPKRPYELNNITLNMDHSKVSYLVGAKAFSCPVSCNIDGLFFSGFADVSSRSGYDLFNLGRGGSFIAGGEVVESNPKFVVTNLNAVGNFLNFIFSPEKGTFIFKDILAEGCEFSFRNMTDPSLIQLLRIDNFTMRTKPLTDLSTSSFKCSKLEMANSCFDVFGLAALEVGTTGYVLNNVLPTSVHASWSDGSTVQYAGNINIV